MSNTRVESKEKLTGSLGGMVVSIVIGFVFYFGLTALSGANQTFDYNNLISGILNSMPKQIAWFFMNFTEAQFYASAFAGVGVIVGGFVAWILAMKNSKYAGFDVCYGSSTMFPWVLASQVISLGLAIFVFGYIDGFSDSSVTWIATFITVVGAPPAVMLLYGPSLPALLTASIVGGAYLCTNCNLDWKLYRDTLEYSWCSCKCNYNGNYRNHCLYGV